MVTLIAAAFHANSLLMNKLVVPFVSTIIKLRISIRNGNHEEMHTTKQSFPTNYHAAILSLFGHFDFDSASSVQ